MSLRNQIFEVRGAVNSSTPTDLISIGDDRLRANFSSNNRRMFWQFKTPFKSFKTFSANLRFRAIKPRASRNKIIIEAITNTDLDLTTLTFNNQTDLDFESIIPVINPLVDMKVPAGTGATLRADFNQINFGLPVQSYTLASGKTMFGFRMMIEGDTSYSGSENAVTSSPVFFEVYT